MRPPLLADGVVGVVGRCVGDHVAVYLPRQCDCTEYHSLLPAQLSPLRMCVLCSNYTLSCLNVYVVASFAERYRLKRRKGNGRTHRSGGHPRRF